MRDWQTRVHGRDALEVHERAGGLVLEVLSLRDWHARCAQIGKHPILFHREPWPQRIIPLPWRAVQVDMQAWLCGRSRFQASGRLQNM